MDILEGLTEAQRQAVTHMGGPLLVLAGAGSGKTRVITCRIAYLLSQGIPDWQVLAITFTNKAAEEMKARMLALLGPGVGRRLIITTFHSFCARMLREYAAVLNIDSGFIIYDTADRLAAIKRVLADLNLDATRFSPDKIENRISHIKRRLITPEEFAQTAGDTFTHTLARIFSAYDAVLADCNAMDFDDLLMRVAMGLRDCEEFRDMLRDRFRHLLIDEYQDTNHTQYLIARDIAQPANDICATGDPDQSIYGWRGADLRNILDFEDDFPNARVIRLEQNYRSTQTILAAAGAVIANNVGRMHKDLWTENDVGSPVTVIDAADDEDEAIQVADRLTQFHDQGIEWPDMAVFYRTNALTRLLEEAFRRRLPQIPYEVVRGRSFYERKEVRDVLAYLHVAVNPRDAIGLRRILNVPPRGIGAKTVTIIADEAGQRGITLLEAVQQATQAWTLSKRATAALADFAELINRIRGRIKGPVQAAIEAVIDETGYRQYLKADKKAGEEREANLDALITAGADYDRAADEEAGLSNWLQTVSLMSEQDDYDETAGRVPLMTLHAAKGLEFRVVFIIGLEDGLLPHQRSRDSPDEIEEERRLFFVGMTRAKEVLILTRARRRRTRGAYTYTVSSEFLNELPPDKIVRIRTAPALGENEVKARGKDKEKDKGEDRTFKRRPPAFGSMVAGALVRHPTYGLGRIVELSGSSAKPRARVSFNVAGERILDLRYAKLVRVETKGPSGGRVNP